MNILKTQTLWNIQKIHRKAKKKISPQAVKDPKKAIVNQDPALQKAKTKARDLQRNNLSGKKVLFSPAKQYFFTYFFCLL
jgi:hypothetical protein